MAKGSSKRSKGRSKRPWFELWKRAGAYGPTVHWCVPLRLGQCGLGSQEGKFGGCVSWMLLAGLGLLSEAPSPLRMGRWREVVGARRLQPGWCRRGSGLACGRRSVGGRPGSGWMLRQAGGSREAAGCLLRLARSGDSWGGLHRVGGLRVLACAFVGPSRLGERISAVSAHGSRTRLCAGASDRQRVEISLAFEW